MTQYFTSMALHSSFAMSVLVASSNA